MAAADLLLDPGVCDTAPTCEVRGFGVARQTGGRAVLPWRADWLEAGRASVDAVAHAGELGDVRFDQVVVHVHKSRAGTFEELADGWERLRPGGALLVCGGNDLGIKATVKRLRRELSQEPEVVANRAHARVVRFRKDDAPGPARAAQPQITFDDAGSSITLAASPGVFSADALDPGTALLLRSLALPRPPRKVFDPGCGVGALGLAAALRWPDARAVLADADARAVRCARHNADALGVAPRCEVSWWDVSEPPPARDCDLVVCNPPYHTGKAYTAQTARNMVRAIDAALGPGGQAWVVTYRKLPLEGELRVIGDVEVVRQEGSYKIVVARRPP